MNRTFKGKSPILVLSWLALILLVFAFSIRLMGYMSEFGNDIISLLMWITVLAPSAIWAIYVSKPYDNFKSSNAISIVFGLLSVNFLLEFIEASSGASVILYPLIMLAYAFACITAHKNISKKICIMVAAICAIIVILSGIPQTIIFFKCVMFDMFDNFNTSELCFIVSNCSGRLLLHIAILLFALSPHKEQTIVSPEQALRKLNASLEKGKITPDEYKKQREKILSEL